MIHDSSNLSTGQSATPADHDGTNVTRPNQGVKKKALASG